jgi:hypothetical protein
MKWSSTGKYKKKEIVIGWPIGECIYENDECNSCYPERRGSG